MPGDARQYLSMECYNHCATNIIPFLAHDVRAPCLYKSRVCNHPLPEIRRCQCLLYQINYGSSNFWPSVSSEESAGADGETATPPTTPTTPTLRCSPYPLKTVHKVMKSTKRQLRKSLIKKSSKLLASSVS